MFGIGSTELLLILVVALIVLGPKSLAKVSRSLGKAMGEFRRVSTDFQRTLNMEAAEEELRQKDRKHATVASASQQPEPQANLKSNDPEPKKPDLPEDTPLAQALARTEKLANENPKNPVNPEP